MFITIEGIDGCGKSTQAARLSDQFRRAGKKFLWTREPGGWNQGNALRSLLLGGNLAHPLTEIMLFMADRCEHAKQTIEPALAAGECVICERYNDSTRAYQCWGRGQDRKKLEDLIEWCGFPEPDLTLWLDIPVENAFARRASRGGTDRFEGEKTDFHRRVAEGFESLALEYADRFVRINASKSEERVEEQIRFELKRRRVL